MPAIEQRPRIDVPKKGIDFFYEWASVMLTLFMWGFCVYHYPMLPDSIPDHYGASGLADSFGPKAEIFITPGIVTAMIVLLRFVNRFPHKFNYLARITPENAELQYRKGIRLLRYMQFFISLLFTYIVVKEIRDAGNQFSKLDEWFFLVFFPGMMIPTVYTVYTSLTSGKEKNK